MLIQDQPMKELPFKLELPRQLSGAIALLRDAGGYGRVVGGSVRDAILGLEPKDFDVEVYGIDIEAVDRVLSRLGKTVLVGKSFYVVKLRIDSQEYDFSSPRRDRKTGAGHRSFEVTADPLLSEKEASSRRDFTINALQYDVENQLILDFHGGLDDIDNRVLRHISDAFGEDPLRPLRAMQFASRFGFRLHPETAKLCASLKSEYESLPIERIWTEWEKWATKSQKPSSGLEALRDMDWLSLYPELEALQGVPQDPEWHPEGDVWQHTLHCVDAMVHQDAWQRADSSGRATLLLAILCHDLGKPECTEKREKRGKLRWTSHGHAERGVPLAKTFLKRIGGINRVADPVPPLVHRHHFLIKSSQAEPSDSSLKRLARNLHPATTEQLAAVMAADMQGRPPLRNKETLERIRGFSKRLGELEISDSRPQPIVLGRHLIEYGLEPGPHFKRLLDAAFGAQLDGCFDNAENGIAWLESSGKLPSD